MKVLKRIGLFLIYPALMLGIGFFAGVESMHFFYPGDSAQNSVQQLPEQIPTQIPAVHDREGGENVSAEEAATQGSPSQNREKGNAWEPDILGEDENDISEPAPDYGIAAREASATKDTLNVDTEYVVEETDVINHTVVETSWRIPDKYIGMNREQFVEAMELYAAFPPLSEQERGFIGLEVLSFSEERVVVRMDYRYVEPSSSFYIGVYDNNVIVYLEDAETVYIETDIRLDSLPQEIQSEIIQMMWIEDESALFNFLESHSS